MPRVCMWVSRIGRNVHRRMMRTATMPVQICRRGVVEKPKQPLIVLNDDQIKGITCASKTVTVLL